MIGVGAWIHVPTFFLFPGSCFMHAVPKSVSIGMAAGEIVVKFLRTHVVSV